MGSTNGGGRGDGMHRWAMGGGGTIAARTLAGSSAQSANKATGDKAPAPKDAATKASEKASDRTSAMGGHIATRPDALPKMNDLAAKAHAAAATAASAAGKPVLAAHHSEMAAGHAAASALGSGPQAVAASRALVSKGDTKPSGGGGDDYKRDDKGQFAGK